MSLTVVPEPAVRPDRGRWLRPAAAAEYLGWTPRHLRRVRRVAVEARYGDPARRMGLRAILFQEADLDDLADWWDAHLRAQDPTHS